MSKGGSTTSEVKVPEYIEAAAQRNLNRADKVSQLGYVPEYGPSVAAFTPNQQAAFQNTANTADAFGMSSPTSQRDIMGGMAPPTTYANGVQGYSSAPMYEQMVAELARNRPGQKSYIDSFFIDPTSGNYSGQSPVDYTQYNTMAQDARNESSANRANQIAVAEAGAPRTYNTSTTTMNAPTSYLPGGVNDPFLTSKPSQIIAGATGGIPGMTAGSDNVYTRTGSAAPTTSIRPVARPDGLGSTPSSSGGILSGGGADGVGNFGKVGDVLGGIGDKLGVTNYSDSKPAPSPASPKAAPAVIKPAPSPSSSSTIKSGDTLSAIAKKNNTTVSALMKANPSIKDANKIQAGASINIPKAPASSSSKSSSSSSSSSKKKCVIATHAVESGAFSPRTKREAVVWCMDVLHGKWWGEAIRRGYRHCGTKKIEQGKAREHYDEFRRYIDFASGKKRTLRGAATFTIRTVQFFAIGLVKRDA